jgi:RNA polymerase sigma-70 factor (ECF subfamily)
MTHHFEEDNVSRASSRCVESVWRVHESELRGYLRRKLVDIDAVDDLLQDVFVKAMRLGQGFCGLDNPRAWLFQVARNALVDRVRMQHPVEPLPEGPEEPLAPADEAMAPVDALAECLLRSLSELSPEDVTILRACDLEGSTLQKFADVRGLSLAAAKSRLLRARQRLRGRLTVACQVRFDVDGNVAGHVLRPPAD